MKRLTGTRRLANGLYVGAGVAFLAAVITGFVPKTAMNYCSGSFFAPTVGVGTPDADGHVSIRSLCRSDGYPDIFWPLVLIGIALLIAAIVTQQVDIHRQSQAASVQKPARATAAVARTSVTAAPKAAAPTGRPAPARGPNTGTASAQPAPARTRPAPPTQAPSPHAVSEASSSQRGTFAPSLAEELKILSDLHDAGGITDEEFAAAKNRVLGEAGKS